MNGFRYYHLLISEKKKGLHFICIQGLKIKNFEWNQAMHFLCLNLFHFDCFSSDHFLYSSSDFWCQRKFCSSESILL